MRLRKRMLQEHFVDSFRVSLSLVSRIMNTWMDWLLGMNINIVYDREMKLMNWVHLSLDYGVATYLIVVLLCMIFFGQSYLLVTNMLL